MLLGNDLQLRLTYQCEWVSVDRPVNWDCIEMVSNQSCGMHRGTFFHQSKLQYSGLQYGLQIPDACKPALYSSDIKMVESCIVG